MSTDVVDVVKNGSDTDGERCIFVVQRSKEHAPETLGRTTLIMKGSKDIAVVFRLVGIKLRRDAIHFLKPRITSSDRISDCSPPFIGSSTARKYNHVSQFNVAIILPDGYILALGSPRKSTMTTYRRCICVKESRRRRHDSFEGKLI